MMIKNKIIVAIVLLGLLSCKTEDDTSTINCDFVTLIDSNLYTSAPNHQLTINSLEINEDCLKINFSASGCGGDTWELKLIDSGAILESNPPQRNLRLSFKNEEACLAFITKELTFDISNLQVDDAQVQLNITNSGDQILYEY